MQKTNAFEKVVASTAGGIVVALATCPFDVVTKRLQAQLDAPSAGTTVFRNSRDAFAQIVKNEGVMTLWRGLGPTLMLTVPATAFYFTFYQTLKENLEQSTQPGSTVSRCVPLVAGPVARTGTVLLTAPLELVRTNVQSRAKSSVSDGTFSLLRHVVRTEGLRGLHRGVLPTLWRDVPFSAIYWFLYEQSLTDLSARVKRYGMRAGSEDREHFLVYFAAGALSGSAAAMITHPFDVVKTRRQMYLARVAMSSEMASYPSTVTGIWKAIVRDEGAMGLYKGLAPRLTKVAPACAIMISSYNFCLDKIHHWNMQQKPQPS